MRAIIWLTVTFGAPAVLFADGGVSIPWSEFKSLYRDSVEREIQKQAPLEKKPQLVSIDEARYALNIGAETAQGEAVLFGTFISGDPEPIPLFSADAVITNVKDVTGGTVLSGRDEGRTWFLPSGREQGFQLTVCFLMQPQEEGGTRAVSLGIPHALRNSLILSLPPESQVVQAAGIADAEGTYHFAACECLTVKYLDRRGVAATAAVEVDTVSRIRVQENRIVMTTSLLPIRTMSGPLILQAPEGAECISWSLKGCAPKKLEGGRFEFVLPPGEKGPFSLEFALQALTDGGEASFLLPTIEGNTGQQGRFTIEEPDDGQVTVTAKGLVSRIPVERLGDGLEKGAGNARFYVEISPNEPVKLKLMRFQSVNTPTTVLDCQYLFSSFEEGGNILSALILDVPPEVGPRIKLKAVPDSEIWSLTVNDSKQTVYAGEDGTWIIPLASGQVSHVELAFLRRGTKLGLQGRLETTVPETGLPCREVRVGVGLPARVELLSVEGPVSAASGEDWKHPSEFSGSAYFFSRSFYKGDGMELVISYKEPVNQPQQ